MAGSSEPLRITNRCSLARSRPPTTPSPQATRSRSSTYCGCTNSRQTNQYRKRAEKAFEAFSDVLSERPTAVSEMLLAVDFHLDTPKEIVVVVPQGRQDAEPFLEELRGVFLPNRILAVVAEGDELEGHSALIPLLEGKVARNGRPTAYVCENRICELPTTDPAVFARQIQTTRPLD